MKNPLENFENPWDAEGEYAQSFLNVDETLVSPLIRENQANNSEQPETYPWRIWGVFFESEQKAYEFIMEKIKTLSKTVELAGYVTERGVFILPSIENGPRIMNHKLTLVSESFLDNKQINSPYKNNFEISRHPKLNLKLKDERYKNLTQRWKDYSLGNIYIYAYIHTHPGNGPLSEQDKDLSVLMDVPIYAIGLTSDGVIRYYEHWNDREGILGYTNEIIGYTHILDHAKTLHR